MLSDEVRRVIDESARFELLISDLYMLFHNILHSDRDFWWTLQNEEKNHAALVRATEEFIDAGLKFPKDFLNHDLEDVVNANHTISDIIKDFTKINPSREFAFNTALKLESQAIELSYQMMMDLDDDFAPQLIKTLQKLNGFDKDHADRIRIYMRNNDIPIHE